MARVTVEDCVTQIPNRFELVMVAAHRARALASGAELRVERDRDKNPVVALREIAEQKLDLPALEESLIRAQQKHIEPDQPEEEVTELMAGEQQNWINADIGTEDSEEDIDEELGDEEGELAADGEEGKIIGNFEDAEVKD